MPQKKKRWLPLVIAVMACVLAGVILFEAVGVSLMVEPYSAAVRERLEEAEEPVDWALTTEPTVTLFGGSLQMVLDTATGHFTIEDAASHQTYASALTAEQAVSSSAPMREAAQSEILLNYYDKNDTLLTMSTAKDALPYGSPKVYTADNAVRVCYRLGVVKEEYLVPIAVLPDTFKEYVAKAGKGARKLQLYYDFFSYENPTATYNEKLKEFPYLEDNEVYLLRQDSVTESVAAELAGYWEEAGYTAEIYQRELEALGLEVPEMEQETSFTVEVIYTLTDAGLTVRVPVDGVQAGLEVDRAYSVTVLPYFAGSATAQEGVMLVPDGSGAIIRLGSGKGASYTQKVYGDDAAKTQKTQTQLTQTAILPAFGVGTATGGYIAYIEGGAPHAMVCAKTKGGIQPADTVYSEFVLQEYDVTTIGESRQMSDIPLFSPLLLQEDPAVTYAFIPPSDNPEGALTAACRQLLEQKNVLPAATETEEWPLFLDFTGILYREKTFLGISYQEKEVLSTLNEVADVVSALHQRGVERLVIRLIGFSADGALGGADCRIIPDKDVGTTEELLYLKELVESKGGSLYWECSLSEVYNDSLFDGFLADADAVRRLNRKAAIVNGVDRVTREYTNQDLARYLVSPANYGERLESVLSSQNDDTPLSLSWGSAGSLLYSDYRTDRPYDRCMTVWAIRETLSRMEEQSAVMTAGGNAYTWSAASAIVDLPLVDSGYEVVSHSYPFVQAVLRGRVDYAGAAVNTTTYPERQILYAAMTGSALRYSWITRSDEGLLDTPYGSECYSLSYTHWIDEAVEAYHRQKTVADATAGADIVDFTQVASGVYTLRYSNDAEVTVNTTTTAVAVDGREVAAMDWVYVPAAGKESAQ